MKDELVSKVMDEVMKKMGIADAACAPAESCCAQPAPACNLTEFVGTAMGHTIGLVIANLDHQVHEKLGIDKKYRSIGIIGDRVGDGPQIFAADEAVKATNSEIVLIECPVIPRAAPVTAASLSSELRTCPTSAGPLRSPCVRWSAPSATCTATAPATWSSSIPPAPATP